MEISKVTNKEDAFLINYYSQDGQKVLLVNGSNVVEELNKAFKFVEDEQKAYREQEKLRYGGIATNGACLPVNVTSREIIDTSGV